jgi:hypothetical protein
MGTPLDGLVDFLQNHSVVYAFSPTSIPPPALQSLFTIAKSDLLVAEYCYIHLNFHGSTKSQMFGEIFMLSLDMIN